MAFKINWDGIYSSIDEIELNADGFEVFETLEGAKKELLNMLLNHRDEYQIAINNVRKLSKKKISKIEISTEE